MKSNIEFRFIPKQSFKFGIPFLVYELFSIRCSRHNLGVLIWRIIIHARS